ncbi:hypothetical protein CBR_g37591 [Chara braunii]|uniref:Peptidase A2 domain-containing protein n=1 Tax=Chara braunii TaxID=69332 RepID=A0A388LNF4_CHABU|nr:hypothetical protein CBR_g37591 [Chara braunii]|eukprot:GBG83791.1 hypothetical protein CBR_g37591 [Chara braunii]
MRISKEKEDVPMIEIEPEEDNEVKESSKEVMGRMEDLMDKIRRLNTRMTDICREVKDLEMSIPHVFTMGQEKEASEPRAHNVRAVRATQTQQAFAMSQGREGSESRASNARAVRATLTAGSDAAYRALRNYTPHTARKPKGGNTSKEPAQDLLPPQAKASIDIGEDKEDQDEVLRGEENQRTEQRAKKRKTNDGKEKVGEKSKKKWRYQTSIEEGMDLENLVNKLLEGHNELLNLKEILATAPKLRELVKAKLARKRVATVRLGDLIPREANSTIAGSKMDWKSVGAGSIDVNIRGKDCLGMVNTGAEMNIMNSETAEKLGLEIDKRDCGYFNGESGKSGYTGRASNVMVEVGRVKVQAEDGEEVVKLDEIVLGDDYEYSEELEGEEFEQGEIPEDFREVEYDGFHLEMGLLLSGDKREREKGGMVGHTRSIPGEEERLRHPMVTRDSAGMPVYKKGDSLRQFLREYENHVFIREWDVPTMMKNVVGVGECRKAMKEMAMRVFGWPSFKVAMWAKYADLRRDEIEDNITFDEINLEDFEDSIGLCAEKNRWDDEEKMEQAAIRVIPRECETVRKIREGSDTWGDFLVEMRKTYHLSIQRQKKRQLFQEQGVRIGRRKEELERTQRKNGNETPPRQGEGKIIRNMEMPEVQGKERRIARKEEGRDKSPEEKEEEREEKRKEKKERKMEEAGPLVRAEATSSMEPLKDHGTRRLTEEER